MSFDSDLSRRNCVHYIGIVLPHLLDEVESTETTVKDRETPPIEMSSSDGKHQYDFIYSADTFADAHQVASVRVPICRATPEAVAAYGQLVSDYEAESVTRVTWPKLTGWRKVASGSGNHQTILDDEFRLHWDEDIIYGDNVAFGEIGMGFATGRLSKDRRHVLVRETNYHPDGSQVSFIGALLHCGVAARKKVFFPSSPDATPYVMLLAPSSVGDDIAPADFRAFWFDGHHGFNIAPGVWHSSPFMLPPSKGCGATADEAGVAMTTTTSGSSTAVYRNKQSSVFACVLMDTVAEYGVYLEVPLELKE